jgi:hypothetical protein
MGLDSYRHSAETFISELTAEYYHHFAGLKDDYGASVRRGSSPADAGAALGQLWREGQGLEPSELLAKLKSEPLDFGVLLTDLDLAQ